MSNRSFVRPRTSLTPFLLTIAAMGAPGCFADVPASGGGADTDSTQGPASMDSSGTTGNEKPETSTSSSSSGSEQPDSAGSSETGGDTDGMDEGAEVEEGELGVFIDVRSIRRAGRVPESVDVWFGGDLGLRPTSLELDGATDLGAARFSRADFESLPDSDIEVPLTVEVRDGEGELLGETESIVDLAAFETLRVPSLAMLAPVLAPVEVEPGAGYFIQMGETGNLLSAELYANDPAFGLADAPSTLGTEDDNAHQLFEFVPVPGNLAPAAEPGTTFLLRARTVDLCLRTLDINYEGGANHGEVAFYWLFFDVCSENNPGQHFELRARPDGALLLWSAWADRFIHRAGNRLPAGVDLGAPIYDEDWGAWEDPAYAPTEASALVRVVAAEIDYTVEDLGTSFLPPLIPPGRIDFAYDQTLSNCSPANYTETIGRQESRETRRLMSTTESLELYSSESSNVQVTAGVSAGFNAFGASVEASLEVSAGFDFTTSSTSATSATQSFEEVSVVEVSREREIMLDPFEQIQVQDAVHVLEGVSVPFVQELEIHGTTPAGIAVSGPALASQLAANGFEGVIQDVADDHVVANIRGELMVDNLFETKTFLTDMGECPAD